MSKLLGRIDSHSPRPTRMLSPRYDADSHAEVRAIVESGFARLKEWLDKRLQHQEDLMMLHSTSRRSSKETGLASSRAAFNDNWEPSRRASGSRSSSKSVPAVRSDEEEEWLLRSTAACVQPGLNDLAIESSASMVAVESIAPPPLPGCPPEPDDAHPCGNGALIPTLEDDESPSPFDHRILPEFQEKTAVMSLQDDSDWQSKLMDVFDQLDLDGSGSIDKQEFKEAFTEVGMPQADSLAVFKCMDKTDNGQVDRVEWLHIVEKATRGSDDEVGMLLEFIEKLAVRQKARGHIYDTDRHRQTVTIIRHDKGKRMAWDILMMFLLFYISLTLPFSLGFGSNPVLDRIDRIFDILFCCDVVLNFRTTYADRDETVIVSGRKIACKYLRTWFLLDFLSSVPFDMITAGLMPSLTPARLLKLGKIAKVMKLLRIGKMLKAIGGSEWMEKLEERSSTKAHQTSLRILKLTTLAFVLCHWLACFGAAVDTGSLDSYFKDEMEEATAGRRYLASMYWAMTTLSTVGYGDITPTSDAERGYAMLAMIIGGAFYGYIVGCVTSIVSDMDLNARAFYDRMDLIQSWLDCHEDIPKLLRRRARKHFKVTLCLKSAIDDSSVVGELSPELRADIAFFIIHEQVRKNPMFKEISNSALANLVDVLQKTHTNADEFMVKIDDPGDKMYFLVEGVARYDKGFQWRPTGADPGQRFHKLIEGDSFGEEIIFDVEDVYTYTIVAITDCVLHSISEDSFKDKYRNMPELRNQMYQSFVKSRKSSDTRHLSEQIEDSAHAKAGQLTRLSAGLSKSWSKEGSHSEQRGGQNPYKKR